VRNAEILGVLGKMSCVNPDKHCYKCRRMIDCKPWIRWRRKHYGSKVVNIRKVPGGYEIEGE